MRRTSDSGRPGAIRPAGPTEDWNEMTKPANRGRWERWMRLARESNPNLDDAQVTRLAEHLQREHCRKMAQRSVRVRQIKAGLQRSDQRTDS